MKDIALAERYARALYLAAVGKKDVSVKSVEEDLRLSWRLIQSYPKLMGQLTHMLLPIEKKKAALKKAIEEVRPQLSPLVRRLLELALDKKRVELLPYMASSFERIVMESSKVVKATVKVAFPLQESMKEKIGEKLSQFFNKKVMVDVSVEPNLIGGIVVKAGDRVIDYSLISQLKRFSYGN